MGAGIHLYQMTCWESGGGQWKINDVKNLSGPSAKWYTPMRILDLTIDEYIALLIKYKAKNFYYSIATDFLSFSFESEKDAKAFCSLVNKTARIKNYKCR